MVRLQSLRFEFDGLKIKDSETIEECLNQVVLVVNHLKVNGELVKDQRVVEKILWSITQKYESIVVAIEESKDLSTMPIEGLVGSLQSYKLRMK